MCDDVLRDMEDFFTKEPSESLDKMSRVVQVRLRMIVVKAVVAEVPEGTEPPSSLQFTAGSMPNVSMDEKFLEDIQVLVESEDKLQFEEVGKLFSSVKAAADKNAAESDQQAAYARLVEHVSEVWDRSFSRRRSCCRASCSFTDGPAVGSRPLPTWMR